VRVAGRRHRHDHDQRAEDHEEGRAQTADAPAGVAAPVERGVSGVLAEEDRRQQLAGQHEEHLDAQEPAGHGVGDGVIEEHGDERDGAQPV
jgi:hypothetical protein